MEIIYTDLEPNILVVFAGVLACAGIAFIVLAIKMLVDLDFGVAIFNFILSAGLIVGSVLLFIYCDNHPSTFVVARFNEEVDINKLFETYKDIQPYKDNLFMLLLK